MNQTDRNNIEFLLQSSPDTLREWFNMTGAADHQYAHDIMTQYSQELTERSRTVTIDQQLRDMQDFPMVKLLLDQISGAH